MTEKRHMTAFYLETILMVIIFALVIAVLAQVFGQARLESRQAQQLTNAVCLAQNAAEAVAAAGSAEALVSLLDENGNVMLSGLVEAESAGQTEEAAATESTGGTVVTAYYDTDMQPMPAPNADPASETGAASGMDAASGTGADPGTDAASETDADLAGQASDRTGGFRVETSWLPSLTDNADAAQKGRFVESEISVYQMDSTQPLYTMQTGVYLKEGVAR